MGEESPRQQPRVVKKVVKRTVVRPISPDRPAPQDRAADGRSLGPERTRERLRAPRVGARPSARTTSRTAGGSTTVADRPVPTTAPEGREGRPRVPRPRFDVGSSASGVGRSVSQGLRRGKDVLGDVGRSGGHWVVDRLDDVRALRLPDHLPTVQSAAIVGVLAGVLAAVLGWVSLLFFSAVRGVATGGGLWGTITLALIAVLVGYLAGRALDAMGVEHGPTVAALGVLVVLVLVLAFFLSASTGPWAALILPGTSLVGFVLAERLLALSADVE